MKAYPLQSISIEEAMDKQFRMVSCIMHHFSGYEQLNRGDLGIHQPENEPLTTMKAEAAIAAYNAYLAALGGSQQPEAASTTSPPAEVTAEVAVMATMQHHMMNLPTRCLQR